MYAWYLYSIDFRGRILEVAAAGQRETMENKAKFPFAWIH
jgi:hypothetical protein